MNKDAKASDRVLSPLRSESDKVERPAIPMAGRDDGLGTGFPSATIAYLKARPSPSLLIPAIGMAGYPYLMPTASFGGTLADSHLIADSHYNEFYELHKLLRVEIRAIRKFVVKKDSIIIC